MKYVRLRVASGDGVALYEKDVDVRDAFDEFVRRMVSDLIRDGTLRTGQQFTAVVIPRYGDTMTTTPLLVVEETPPATERWLEMKFEEPPAPGRPIRYFTVMLHVPELKLAYRRDVKTMDVGFDYVHHGIEPALVQLGVLKHGDVYRPSFFARDDDEADFEHESLPGLKQEADSLVEFVADESVPAFEERDPAEYGAVEVVGDVGPDDVRIYVRRGALEQLQSAALVSLKAERGGMLVGQVFRTADGNGCLVEVSDLTISEDSASSLAQFTFTFESWRKHSQEMRERFPGRRVVGWYHTHLVSTTVMATDGSGVAQKTRLFFSRDDVFTQKKFFRDEWYVALVLDPEDGHLFFRMKDGEVVPCAGYYLFDDPSAPAAT